MQRTRWIVTIALTLLAMVQAESFAQGTSRGIRTRGLFGDRTLGRSLQPRPRTFASGIELSPSGRFIGRVSDGSGGRTFSSTARAPAPNRITGLPAGPIVNTYDYGPVEISKPLVGPEASAPGADFQAPGDVWFRGAAPSSRSPAPAPAGTASAPFLGTPAPGTPTTGGVPPGASIWNSPLPGSGPMRYIRRPPGSREVGFGRSSSTFESTAGRLSRRISQSRGIASNTGVVVSIENGVATLRGSVATPRDRALAGHMTRFEPGVSTVNNELVVLGNGGEPANR